MNDYLREFLEIFDCGYSDVILVCIETHEEHLKHLRRVLTENSDKLRCHKITVRFIRFYYVREVEYLGHIISDDGNSDDESKVNSIQYWPIPRNKIDLQSFLGLLNYYGRIIEGCAAISKPLKELSKNGPFSWNPSTEESKLRRIL